MLKHKLNEETIEALRQVNKGENLSGPFDSFDDYLEYIKEKDVLNVSDELIEKNPEAYDDLANEREKPHIIAMIWDDYDEGPRPYDRQYTDDEFRQMKWFMNSAMVVKKYRKQYPEATFSDCMRATGLEVHQVAWNWPKKYEFNLSSDIDVLSKKDSSFTDKLADIQKRFTRKDYGNVDDDQIMANLTAFSCLEGLIYSCYPSKWGDICIDGMLVDGEPIVNAQVMFLSRYNDLKNEIKKMEEKITG